MKQESMKGFLAVITAVISYLSNCFSEIVVILGLLMAMDYILGMVSTILTNKPLSLRKSVFGLIKKSSYIACLMLSFLADYLVLWTSSQMNITLDTKGMLGMVTCLYLIGTEGLSILKHLGDIGIPVPKVLEVTFSQLQEGGQIGETNIH